MLKTHLPLAHPKHLVAYSLVHHRTTSSCDQSIYSVAALEVTLESGTDIEFKRHHWIPPVESFSSPYHELFALVQS